MSFLAQVIANAGEAEIIDLKDKISEIGRKIRSLDCEVKEYLENNYLKCIPLLRDNHLQMKAQSLSAEMEHLQIRITNQTKRDLETSIVDFKKITSSHQETSLCLNILEQLLKIDTNIKNAEQDHNQKFYLSAAKKLKTVQDILLPHGSSDIEKLNIYKPLVYNITSLQDRFLRENLQVWNAFIVWNEYDKQENKIKHLDLTVDNNCNKSEVIQVLQYYDYLDYEVKLLSNKILKSLLQPIIDHSSVVNTKYEDGKGILRVEFHLKEDKPKCIDVIAKLGKTFNFLSNCLDIIVNNDDIFINQLGLSMEQEFCEYFITNCLSDAIPTKQEEFSEFSSVIQEVIHLDEMLKEKGILQHTNNIILDYVKNADSLIASKTCQMYLVEARTIFERDLHVTVQVGPKAVKAVEFTTPLKSQTINLEDSNLELCKNTFQFPECQISKSAEDLLSLIRDILEETSKSSNLCSGELFYTARNIISLYCDLMPLLHRNLLKSIPQQSALFYNNCMYLAHELPVLGVEYSSLLSDNIATFVDFVEPLRMLGQSTLNAQVETQRKQLVTVLRESGISHLDDSSMELPPCTEKSFRQCLRQLSLLQSVWQNTMATSIYCKTMGSLCNTLLEGVIDSVISMEGISIDMATQLTEVFSIFLNKIPNFFHDPKEIYRHIKRWSKFGELIKILNSSLKDIDDRWVNGKGPLAQEFSADHIRHLIRALFQNTHHRATLLSRIK